MALKLNHKKLELELVKLTEYTYPKCLGYINYDRFEQAELDEDGSSQYKCLCGKKNLKDLHYFTHEGEEFIIGSSCVLHFQDVINNDHHKYKDIDELTKEQLDKHITKIINKMKKNQKEKNNFVCKLCNQKNIKIKDISKIQYDYELIFCKSCYYTTKYGAKISCKRCDDKSIKLVKDFYGNYKTLCYGCYKDCPKNEIKKYRDYGKVN